MGFDLRFTLTLVAWIAAVFLALLGLFETLERDGLAAVRIVAGLLVAGCIAGLWRHVARTNVTVARFIEALAHGDVAARFDTRGGAGFNSLGVALNAAMKRLQHERQHGMEELRFLEGLVDDLPVALLTIDARGVRLANRAARRLFGACEGTSPEDFAMFGATLAIRLADGGREGAELIILRLPAGPQRAILRSAALIRLGAMVRAVTVEPVQGTLDAVEIAAQTDLVRVLTHEILNSLTPVTSLSATAATLLEGDTPDVAAARVAVETMARRATGLHGFIASYRKVSVAPQVRVERFHATPFGEELIRLIRIDWPALDLAATIDGELVVTADPDLLAQALINLLRNAAQAASAQPEPKVRLSIGATPEGEVRIAVEDNGAGVPEGLRRDIFLPFFTTRAEGTGVGLNLVRQIVVAHGWAIDVEDVEGGGARFRIVGRM